MQSHFSGWRRQKPTGNTELTINKTRANKYKLFTEVKDLKIYQAIAN